MKPTGGLPHRKEPNNTTTLDENPEFSQMFREVGCYNFCRKIHGYH